MKSPRRPRRVRPTSLGEPEEPEEPEEPDEEKRCAEERWDSYNANQELFAARREHYAAQVGIEDLEKKIAELESLPYGEYPESKHGPMPPLSSRFPLLPPKEGPPKATAGALRGLIPDLYTSTHDDALERAANESEKRHEIARLKAEVEELKQKLPRLEKEEKNKDRAAEEAAEILRRCEARSG